MTADRPNIVFILTDQFRFDCLSALNHPVVQTPNLDALAADSVLFTQGYCASMACGPSRSCMFSGRHTDTHRAYSNCIPYDPPDLPALPEFLRDAGYDTALVGKLHLHPFDRTFGFSHFLRSDSCYRNYYEDEATDSAYVKWLRESEYAHRADEALRLSEEDEASLSTDELRFMLGSDVFEEGYHITPWTVRESVAYLRQRRHDPFFLNVSFFGPHQPYLCPGKWGTLYPAEEIPLPDDFYVRTADKPIFTHSKMQGFVNRRNEWGWDEAMYRRILSAYYGNIAMIDWYVGTLFETLKEEGLWDSTLIVFTADHGDYMGQFRATYKGLPYEGSIHVPFIVRDPRAANRGRRDATVLNNMDLFATFLAAAGCEAPLDTESRDLTAVIAGDASSWENRTFFKHASNSAIIRDHYKLMRDTVNGAPVYELYDLDARPLDGRNLVPDPAHAQVLAALRAELDPWHADQESPTLARATGARSTCSRKIPLKHSANRAS